MPRLTLFCLSMLLLSLSIGVRAEITRVAATDSGDLGQYGDRRYIWVKATFEGTVNRTDGSSGSYRVPVTLYYSDKPTDRPGLIDLINSASYGIYAENKGPFGKRNLYRLSEIVFGDHLWNEGFHSMNLQWARRVTWVRGTDYGVIDNARDGYLIWQDAADFFRNPAHIEGDVAFQPKKTEQVIAFGYSQPASLLNTFVRRGMNRRANGQLVFDGILSTATSMGKTCRDLVNDDTFAPPPAPQNPSFEKTTPCDIPMPPDGKFISIPTQTDVAFDSGHLNRDNSPDFYRQYELAGISHIPSNQLPLKIIGANRQNPADQKPFYRAALNNLADWLVDGMAPPPSAYLTGHINSEGKFEYQLDDDGNVVGGIRLPHMTQSLGNGEIAGAPLGVYTGVEPKLAGNGFGYFSGTFTPFTTAEFNERYADDATIEKRVVIAADTLLAKRHIVKRDHAAYINSARYWKSRYVALQ